MSFHKRLKVLSAASFLFCSSAVACFAQVPDLSGGVMPKACHQFRIAKVGTYVEYRLINNKSEMQEILRFSVVGEEKTPKGKFWWYETRSDNNNTGGTIITKMLISGDPRAEGNINRMIVKYNQEKPTEIPAGFLKMSPVKKNTEKTIKGEKGEIKESGREKITTPAGTFDCVRLLYQENASDKAELWTSKKVPIFGLVKYKSEDKELELISCGKDATSAISEQPGQIFEAK